MKFSMNTFLFLTTPLKRVRFIVAINDKLSFYLQLYGEIFYKSQLLSYEVEK